jgi:hypothetical protein
METIERDRSHSVLEEQRAKAGVRRWDDFPETYRAQTPDESHHRVELLEAHAIGDDPLLWFTSDYAEAVVDAAILGDLKIVDVTSLPVGERVRVGVLSEQGMRSIGARDLARFLIEADAIGTYVHIGSTLCLVSESKRKGIYRATFTGEHVYFTNEENHDLFGFVVEMGLGGEIEVVGTEPLPFQRPSG